MRESNLTEAELMQAYQSSSQTNLYGVGSAGIGSLGLGTIPGIVPGIVPFFSMRKLRLIYNELADSANFEFTNFEDFKHQVLSSVVPQLELNKWQAIASRR
jgi:hypothetical protein